MSAHPAESSSNDKRIMLIGLAQAARLGLRHEDAQDCAMEFVARMLTVAQHPRAVSQSDPNYVPWLNRCARNYACNYLRALMRRRQREVTSTEGLAQVQPEQGPGPRTLTLRKELWTQVVEALKQLTPAQRELFVRYHFRNQSLQHIASRTGRAPHAIAESLSNTRKRVAALLKSQGWTDADAQTLFQAKAILRPKT